MLKILTAEPDEKICSELSEVLKHQGYEVYERNSGYELMKAFHSDTKFDLIILNTCLNEIDGTEICKIIRKISTVPIIFTTNKPNIIEEIKCFDAGCDDYIKLDYSYDILIRRVYAVFRRYIPNDEFNRTRINVLDGLVINNNAHEVTINNNIISLTSTEYDILFKLTSNKGRVYSREQLLDTIWGYDYEGTTRTVDTHVARLRAKLGEWGKKHFQSVFGMGYKVE